MINMGYDMHLIKGLIPLKPLLLAAVLFPCGVNATTLLEAIRNAGAVNPELQAAMYRQLAGRVAAQMYWQGEAIPTEIAFRAV